PLGSEKLAVRPARVIGIEPAVVADDQHAVLGHGEIELERGHADRERRGERFERVLRHQAAGAAMALQVEGDGGGGCNQARGKDRRFDHPGHGSAPSDVWVPASAYDDYEKLL